MLWQQAHGEKAIAVLQHARALEPALVRARISLARRTGRYGSVDAAAAEFREVVQRDPDSADGWCGRPLNTVLDAADAAHLKQAFAHGDLLARTICSG